MAQELIKTATNIVLAIVAEPPVQADSCKFNGIGRPNL